MTLCSIALYAILSSGFETSAAVASPEPQLTVLGERVTAVKQELHALAPGKRAARPRRAVLAAMKAREEAAAWLTERRRTGAPVKASERLANTLDVLEDWLDAVGSTLSNPYSRRQYELQAIGRRLRAGLGSLPAELGLAGASGGEQRLLAFAAGRR